MDLIIGAGITGLSYAAYTNNDYLIIEKELEPGGYCRTIKKDGFVWDYSGHFFHFQDPEIKQEVMDGIPQDHILKVNKHTQIRYGNRMIDYPFQKNIHQLTQEEFIDCLYDLFNNPYTSERSFKEMLFKKFGKSIAEKFLIPYNEKLYACDLNTLDVDAMGRFFPYANKEDIIANFKPSKENSYNSFFLYPKGGAIEYIDSICKRVDMKKISFGEYLVSIDMQRKIAKTNYREIEFTNLISSIPFPSLLKACKIEYDKSLYSCNKVLVFNIGFDKKGLDTKNNWIYYPEDKYIFYRVGCYDNIYQNNRLSVYVEIGFKEDAPIDIDNCFNKVLTDLKEAELISDHKVISYCTVVMNPAYVHITKEMEADKIEKRCILADMNIYSIGRYGSWIYCSIEDNIKEAKDLAIKLRTN